MSDPTAADDVTSDVFTRVLQRLGTYRPDWAPFAAWLFGIARNAVSDHFRSTRRRRWISLDALRGRPAPVPQPEEEAMRRAAADELLAAVARLPDRA